MKFSFMSFSCPELNLDELLALVKKYGYDGVEPRISASHKHGLEFDATAEYRAQAKRKAEATGVPYSCIATSCRYADPATRNDMVADTHRAIDLAGDVGCGRIRVFGGAIPEGIEREEATDGLIDAMRAVADHAAERNVVVCMETHDHWCNPAHLAEVMRRVSHPAIAINWDIMHPVRVAKVTIEESFRILEPWIRHCHFHDGTQSPEGALSLCPIGEGLVDHRKAVELLKAVDFEDFMSGEWIGWEPYDVHLPREIATMRRYDKEAVI